MTMQEVPGLTHLSWVVTAYLLASTATAPIWGKVSDLYSRKRVYQLAIPFFLIGSALCGFAQEYPLQTSSRMQLSEANKVSKSDRTL